MKAVLGVVLVLLALLVLLLMYQQPRFVMAFADLITACF
jgi:hypothetical protein